MGVRNRVGVVWVALACAIGLLVAAAPVRADGWDYVYGDPGPTNFSRYVGVQIAGDGSVYLAGFYSGAFNGLSSPDAYRYFVQHVSTTGTTLWTKEVPTAPLATNLLPITPDLVIDGLGGIIFRVNSHWYAYDSAGDKTAEATVGFEQPQFFEAPTIVPANDGGAVELVNSTSGSAGAWELQHRGADLSLEWAFSLAGLIDNPNGCNLCAPPAVLGVSDGTYWVIGQKNKALVTQQNALSMIHVSASGAKITSILHFGITPALMFQRGSALLAATDTFIWVSVQTSSTITTPLPVMSFATSDGHALGMVDSKLPSVDIASAIGAVNCKDLSFATEYANSLPVGIVTPQVMRRAVLLNGTRLVVVARCASSVVGPSSSTALLLLSYSFTSPLGGSYTLVASREISASSSVYGMGADAVGNAVVVGSTTDGVVYASRVQRKAPHIEDASSERAVATRNPLGNLNDVHTPTPSPGGTGSTSQSDYVGLLPTRVFDTRPNEADGAVPVLKAKVGGTKVLSVHLAGSAGVPVSGAGAVSLNVTVTDPTGAGYLTVYPCGTPPQASNLNFVAGQTVANAVIAPLSASGDVCFASNVDTHVLADVNGWLRSGSGFTALTPTRVFDTRPGSPQGVVPVDQHPYGGGTELRVRVIGAAGLPLANVGAVSLNVTVADPVDAGFVTVYPCGTRPNASNLNFVAGQTVPNAVIAPVSPNGEICLYSSVNSYLLADVNGWFATGSSFKPLTSARLVDTRPTQGQGTVTVIKQKYGPATVLKFTITGFGGVPATGVSAVALNVTVVDPDTAGFVTVFPCGDRPLASNVNFLAGQTVPNAVVVPVSTAGEVCVFSNTPTHILVDVNGWIGG